MAWVHRTMIVPAALVASVRGMAESLAGSGGSDMWTTPLAPTPTGEPTHYISAGLIEEEFAYIMGSAEALSGATGLPIEQATAILSVCTVSEVDALTVMSDLGLVMVVAEP
jgi:hypothetical protein